MWLLDHNLPHQLRDLLTEFGIESETAVYRGWDRLRNGELVAAAYKAGFQVILTRDVKFGQSAASELPKYPNMGVVIVRLPQRSAALYLAAFREAWEREVIVPKIGTVQIWPSK